MNYVWVYGWEAHPEEDPFPGTESADLGWEHPYNVSTTMQERAQRAGWLKTDLDPDGEIPMMIDYIDDAPNSDNAIKYAYMGDGFYSGFVIDCDGTVIKKQDWGWYDDGGDWMGLPLEHVDDLHNFLDDYLADPPDCYATADADSDADTDADADGDTDGDGADDLGGGDAGSCSHAVVRPAPVGLLSLLLAAVI